MQGKLEIQVMPGNHKTMFQEPHVYTLAKEFQRAVEMANSQQSEVNP